MKIYFRTNCRASLIEHWCIEPPPTWQQMSKGERLAWLQQNCDSAQFRSQEEVHDEEDRTVIDFL
ncbi:MAG TPA: hypothetical protein VFN18_10960 [Solirubrobacterales bacterium]|nr:hypothetical protein [Solirubrobacterales bacterium]